MRGRILTICCLIACLSAGFALPARAQSLADLVDACRSSGQPEQYCRGLYAQLRTDGQLCRDATMNAAECAYIDGVVIDEGLVAAQESSWLNKALALQRGLDDDHPLQDELWTHTHNSFNADAYAPTFYGLDRNHIYTITDQLRMGVRAIEIDVWYAPTLPNGDPAKGFNALIACHGQAQSIGPVTLDIGCGVNDPLLVDRLKEVRDWLDDNPGEFLMLYLENNLPSDKAVHELAGQALQDTLGSRIYSTPTDCANLPMDTSRKQLRSSGAQIILTGNCSAGAGTSWGGLVHDRGPRWIEGGLDYGDDFTAEKCASERVEQDYPHNWIRHWGDETGLSAAAGEGGDTTPADVANEVACGVNMVGWDNLVPFDQRMHNMVWSWAVDEPSVSVNGACANMRPDGHFYAKDCSVTKEKVVVRKRKHKPPITKTVDHFVAQPFACYDGTNWHVTTVADRWSHGAAECAAEHLGAFAVPWNGYENGRLLQATGGRLNGLWLNYHASGGSWLVGS